MVTRAILDSTKLVVSKPTYDASTSTGSQLVFDSRANKYLAPYLTGVITANDLVYNPNGSIWSDLTTYTIYSKTIPYGKTFSIPPQAFLAFRSSYIDPNEISATCWWNISSIETIYDQYYGGTYSIGNSISIGCWSQATQLVIEARRFVTAYPYTITPAPNFIYYMVAQST